MIKSSRVASMFFVLSILIILAAIPYSAAINRIILDRNTNVKLVEDKNAALRLVGFNNMTYNMSNKYESFGTVTNNTGKTILLTVTVIPDYQIYHFLSKFGIKIGEESCEFQYTSTPSKQMTLTLSPGQTAEAKAYLVNNLFYTLPIDFQFTAVDTTGTFTIKLLSTSSTPRRININ